MAGEDQTQVLANTPIDPYQIELLGLAYDAASRIPLHPHIKDRTKAQQDVVTAALTLEQPLLAVAYAEQIADWRRGDAYAAIAFWSAERGLEEDARRFLDIASDDMQREEEEWRRDRVRAGIARTLALLGDDSAAAALERDLLPGEVGKAEAARTQRAESEEFDQHLAWAQQTAAIGAIDFTRNAMAVCAGLFDRFYDDDAKRQAAEETIRASWGPVPILMRLEVLQQLVEIALRHDDAERARALASEASTYLVDRDWLLEDRIALGARLAALRHAAGETVESAAELERLRAEYAEGHQQIGLVFRAGALRALAEAHAATGDIDGARERFAEALETALENRNGRPRAEDLTAIATSLAVCGVEPDVELAARLREARDGLGAPW